MKVINEAIKAIENKEETCWAMIRVFLENRNAHGLHTMSVEIQALQRAKAELEKLYEA